MTCLPATSLHKQTANSVHLVQQRFVRPETSAVLRCNYEAPFERLPGLPGDMGRQDDVVEAEDRIFRVDGLQSEEIEARCGKMPRPEDSDESRLIHYFATPGVDQDGARIRGRRKGPGDPLLRHARC